MAGERSSNTTGSVAPSLVVVVVARPQWARPPLTLILLRLGCSTSSRSASAVPDCLAGGGGGGTKPPTTERQA
eukprot:101921-Prymnesium_polylepis.1